MRCVARTGTVVAAAVESAIETRREAAIEAPVVAPRRKLQAFEEHFRFTVAQFEAQGKGPETLCARVVLNKLLRPFGLHFVGYSLSIGHRQSDMSGFQRLSGFPGAIDARSPESPPLVIADKEVPPDFSLEEAENVRRVPYFPTTSRRRRRTGGAGGAAAENCGHAGDARSDRLRVCAARRGR